MTFGVDAKGVYPIAATPFNADMSVDYDSVDRLTEFYQDAGAAGMTILGILGEAQKLEPEESLTIARRVIARSRVPVVVGVSNPSFAAMRRLAREVTDAGAAGVMLAPASHLRSDEQIAAYFHHCVEAIGPDVPWALQDYPLTLSVVLSVPMISRIMKEHPSCVMLKAEDWPGLEKISVIRKLQAAGDLRKFSILTANGGLFLDFEPERGSDGAMTGYAFPDMLVELDRLHREGQRDAAHDLFDAHLPLIRFEQQQGIGLAVRKYVLMRRGAITSDVQRSPRSSLTPAGRSEVDYLLERLARKDPRARL
ncbi:MULTISPECIES: dihydrodipicolinate synthase family protein [unclassified Mesorhizobium]|uniref:dihydrodipicolinate synthase family protein n=1 Tax=unclassified Mesorhizobium TaxID=325217 RepID=UPI000FD364C9|nr:MULTISPECIES: dihydrodipicolinate synthase family protein [unclassified Mesorhizobium]RVB77454.1 dihydrodipicolinate synthase family protein [Mesorhizobium sp. M6A.T.Cr.TU.014.01.1.1]RWP71485.1 MAG: dihydrodipicolinate synthase family protein [Mesorhizobium sp.]RWQ01938.1 MAG: dihydrodipicolinate synthase family protein [Mesorhizobium sp.]RWQ03065.1 MAG: dihydrodipicolinate synthase family protein [Mesorhizobium sp.]